MSQLLGLFSLEKVIAVLLGACGDGAACRMCQEMVDPAG